MRKYKFFILITIFSLCYIISYKLSFNTPTKTIFYHLITIISIELILIFIGFFLFKIQHNYLNKIYRIIWVIMLFLIALGYILAWVGRIVVERPIQFKIFWVYLMNFKNTIIALNIPIYLIIVLLLSIPFLFLSLYFFVPKNILEKSSTLVSRFNVYRKSMSYKSKLFSLIISVAIFSIINIFIKTGYLQSFKISREPLSEVYLKLNFQIEGMGFLGGVESPKIRAQYPKSLSQPTKNVIIIIVDALRADMMNIYGYPEENTPFLNSLYQRGKLAKVTNTFSTSAKSAPGILSILRSKFWYNMGEYNFSINELLHDYGYRTNFLLSGDHESFFSLKTLFGPGIDFYFDGRSTEKYYPNDDELIFEGLNKVPNYNTIPNFFYFHLMSVHELGLKQNEFIKHKPASSIIYNKIEYVNNYLNGMLQLNAELENIFKELDKKGFLKNSIICITSDHAESLGERNEYGHNINVYNSQINIPLLIYDSDSISNYKTDTYALQADISTTIIDRLGLPIPHSWDGLSLLQNKKHKLSFHVMRENYAIIKYEQNQVYKFCYNTITKKEELYNIKKDFSESNNLISNCDENLIIFFRAEMNIFINHCTK